jgi:hypothetical protein
LEEIYITGNGMFFFSHSKSLSLYSHYYKAESILHPSTRNSRIWINQQLDSDGIIGKCMIGKKG